MNAIESTLPVGKLPPSLLAKLISRMPVSDSRVLMQSGIGLDCAVVDVGPMLLVFKSDPITFATDEIGRYLVAINANDIATTGAIPRWLLLTMLLPETSTTPQLVEEISEQVFCACREIGVSVIGGHTEITHGLDRPILAGTLVGEVQRERLITPRGASAGDRLLLTKGVPIEATAILAREFPETLKTVLSTDELACARQFLKDPGISILRDATTAVRAGKVTAMHDPTEGGIAAALWELAEASNRSIFVDPAAMIIPEIALRVCETFDLDPFTAIASGALLLTVPAPESVAIRTALRAANIPCSEIGVIEEGPAAVWRATKAGREIWPRPERDAITRVFARLRPKD